MFVFHVDPGIVSPTNGIITGMIAVLEAVTRGKAIGIEISLVAETGGSAVSSAAYISEDKALMRFSDGQGQGHTYKVPGLLPAILEADKETIDPANSFVLAYIAAVNTYAKGRGGNSVATFVSGHRTENRKPIKAGRV